MPLPCSPVSNSTASESYSVPGTSEEDSDASLTTPRAGPVDPALRTSAALSKPSVPTFSTSPESVSSPGTRSGASQVEARADSSIAVRKSDDSAKPSSRKSSIRFQTREPSPRRRALGSFQAASGMSKASPGISPLGNRADSHERDLAESSADENTAIFRREPPSQYGAVGASTSDEPTLIRRKSALGKAKDPVGPSTLEGRSQEDRTKNGECEGWWQRAMEKYGSIELENKGSVARDHLALERTFLAWLRTSLSFASIGIAVTQLFRLNTSLQSGDGSTPSDASTHLKQVGKPLGATFLGISILILLLGFNRYFEGQHYIIRGKFPASRLTVVLVSIVAGALIVASLAVVLVIAPSAFES